MKLIGRLRCRIGWHRRLDVIQSFGSAQHIGCPDCGKRFGIHHGIRSVVPWDADLHSMYEMMGYDVNGPLSRWERYRAVKVRQ
ncbi:hypothetical protein SJ05684_c30170 [Sinorhizobium sojae CCBAU 05684]|uniref:Uncharacterized protein n=1 Tax=Sinorhizobium sojae CCBAU 05684 TaxID=716928 RepID=A0A249PET5_9HYPH|nr:hypothetical protein [Sinorhizobium sojae]ASY64441.1 hypothetical protein SJ05684_c30170 [Sinorhizobium sojae CCBAU 05684]